MTNTMPCRSLPVVVPEQSMGPTADGVQIGRRPPQGGRHRVETPPWEPLGPLVLLLFVDLDQDLAALTTLGGFFVLRTGEAPRGPLPTLAYAYANQSRHAEGNPITFRVEKVRQSLRTPEARVAASVAQQGFAARLWSVTLGCPGLYGPVPDLDPRLLHWDPAAGAPDDLWLAEVRPLP